MTESIYMSKTYFEALQRGANQRCVACFLFGIIAAGIGYVLVKWVLFIRHNGWKAFMEYLNSTGKEKKD